MSSWTFRFSVFLQPEFFQADIFFFAPIVGNERLLRAEWGGRTCPDFGFPKISSWALRAQEALVDV